MKRINKSRIVHSAFCILYSAFCIALLASCQAEDDAPAAFDPAVRITTTMTEAANAATRAATATYPGTDLALSIDYGIGNTYTRNNVKWTTTDGGNNWTPAEQMLWRNATDPAQIYAYAPHVSIAQDGSITAIPFSVQRSQNAEGQLLKSDLVGYTKSAYTPSADNAPMPIVFSHRLAKLTINLTLGSQWSDDTPIASASLLDVFASGTYNATTGAFVTATDAAAPSDPNKPARTIIGMHRAATTAPGVVATYEVILPPQTIASGAAMIEVTLANGVSYRYTAAPAAGHTFATATAYTMTLRVGKDKLTLGNVTVNGWEDGAPIPGGEATKYTFASVEAGQLAEKLTADPAYLDAIVNSTAGPDQGTLLLKGSMNDADITALRTWAMTHIDGNGVADAYALRHLDMSGVTGMEKLRDFAFYDDRGSVASLITVVLPPSLKEIGAGAFFNCTALTTVSSLDNVSTIGISAFQDCTALTTVGSLSNVGTIGKSAFSDCAALTTVGSLSKVTSIGAAAFNGCTNLTAVDAPDVKTVGDMAFQDCSNLGTITLGKLAAIADNQYIFDTAKITTLNLPACNTVGSYAFRSATIGTLNLPACSSVGNDVFFNATIGTLNLPVCSSVANNAFSNATIGTLRFTTIGSITMGDEAFINFAGSSNTTLFLHQNKKQGDTSDAMPKVTDGNKWGNINPVSVLRQWKAITYVDDNGNVASN